MKYLANVWLSSDTTGHDSAPKISKYSAKGNAVEELKSQTNGSKVPISSNCYLIMMRLMTNKQTSWKMHD